MPLTPSGSRSMKSVRATVDGSNKISVRYHSVRLSLVHDAHRIFVVDGKAHSFQLPSTLARGGYLLRHEIIALHLADQPGGAEFYPACIQINVGGSQSGTPSPSELVQFPGAYTDNDPGILVNAFSDAAYQFPGPAISKLASKTSGSNDVNPDNGNGSPSPSPSPSKSHKGTGKTPAQPSPTAVPSEDDSEDCASTEKRDFYDDSDDFIPPTYIPASKPPQNDFKPRHISRVMARLVKFHSH